MLAIKEMALTSSGEVLSGEAIFNLVHVLHDVPVDNLNHMTWKSSGRSEQPDFNHPLLTLSAKTV